MGKLASFVLTFVALLNNSSFAGSEDAILAKLERAGFRCLGTDDHEGYLCRSGQRQGLPVYLVVPKGLRAHSRSVFYAHGLLGVCAPGASGEGFLAGESAALQRAGAVAVLPIRQDPLDPKFPLAAYLSSYDSLLGRAPWTLVGHSAGGQFLAGALAAGPLPVAVNDVLLLDAVYNVGLVAPLWDHALRLNASLRLKMISSTTAENAAALKRELAGGHSRLVSLEVVQEDHCRMPRYFSHGLGARF